MAFDFNNDFWTSEVSKRVFAVVIIFINDCLQSPLGVVNVKFVGYKFLAK